MSRTSDKRVRLMEAAQVLIHQKGFYLTTLADIAEVSGVPLGNVYYYFKTKEAIGEMVISHWSTVFHDQRVALDSRIDVMSRLMGYVEYQMEKTAEYVKYGCPVGSLCQELSKYGGNLANLSASLIHSTLEWSNHQFEALGFTGRTAETLGTQFIARIQGGILLAHTFHDPKQMEIMQQGLKAWLKSLVNEKMAA